MADITKDYLDHTHLSEYDTAIKQWVDDEISTSLTDFEGATSSADGVAGQVPAPNAGDNEKFLRGDGTWSPVVVTGSVTGVKGSAETTYREGNVNITPSNIGLGNVGNYKAVSTVANQGLTETEQVNARSNIGAGTSSFSGSFNDLTDKPTVDSELSETSTNPLQNKVITDLVPEKFGDTWNDKTWSGLSELYGTLIWTDGENIYYSNGTAQYVLDKSTSTWSAKSWNGISSFLGNYIWTDGDNIYYSQSASQYVLDKSTSTWTSKSWNGLSNFSGALVWTDGDHIYYSNGTAQYVLDESTSTWSVKSWSGLSSFSGSSIWTDGNSIYYSLDSQQYVLDKSTSNWKVKTWCGLSISDGRYIWTDGNDIYFSYLSQQYVLDKSAWKTKAWSNPPANFNGGSVWTDGDNIYYSSGEYQFVLSKEKDFGTSAAKDYTDSVVSGSKDVVTSGGVYEYTQSLAFKGTTAQWNALSTSEKAKYDGHIVVLMDD